MELAELKPNPDNPRKVSAKKLKALKKSMDEFGDLSGVIYNKRSGQLIGGHQRVQLLKGGVINLIGDDFGFIKVGDQEFTLRLVDWDDAKEKAANIAANKGAGEWDDLKLAEWFKELDAMDFDLSLTMFDEEEIAPYLKVEEVEAEPLGDEEGIPDEVETRSKLGDIWILGEHKLMCGDSTNPEHVDKLIEGFEVDLVYTDPPYGINEKGDRVKSKRSVLAKAGEFESFADDTTQYAVDAFNYCSALGIKNQVWWGANYYAHTVPETANWIIWDKRVEENNHNDQSDCEMAWVQSKWSAVRIFRHLWKGMIRESEKKEARVHPTQKPVALAEWCFDTYFQGDVKIVLDLFGGSGSTLIACEKTKRKCLAMEIMPIYVDTIISRWEKFTGKTAMLTE